MAEERTAEWPHFRLVTYTAPTGIPHEWDAELLEQGAPDGLGCTPMQELALWEHPDVGPLVRFGTGHLVHTSVCLHPRTNQVLCVNHAAFRTGDPQPTFVGRALVVNSSLDHFIASVRSVTERFPFDSEGSGEDREDQEVHKHKEQKDQWAYEDEVAERLENERTQAGDDLIERLRRIDPAAIADLDGFWHIFVADVQMGIYSIRNMLTLPDS